MDFLKEYFDQFLPLSKESFALVCNCIEKVEIKSNTLIMTEGKVHPYIYIIKNGIVRGYTTNDDGTEDTKSFWQENETFGDVKSYISNLPVSKNYVALEDLIVYKVNKVKFRELFYINIELANLGRLMIEKFVFRSDIREQILNVQKPCDRYTLFSKLRKRLNTTVKLKHIASFLKITPETLSRIRKS